MKELGSAQVSVKKWRLRFMMFTMFFGVLAALTPWVQEPLNILFSGFAAGWLFGIAFLIWSNVLR